MSDFTSLPIPTAPIVEHAAAIRAGIGVNLSQSGGASLTAQYDSNGNLVTGAFSNNGVLMDNGGNIYIPDVRGIRWLKQDGTLSGFSIYGWEDHDANGGELIIGSPYRTALVQPGAFQLGDNSSALRAFFLHIVSGEATASRTIRHSAAISMQTRTHNSGAEVVRRFVWQAVPSDTTNETVAVKGFFNASIAQENTNPSAYTPGAGLASGDLGIEITKEGAWTPGLAPAFASLTDGATVTVTCSKYRSVQAAKVTLAGNRTLAISGAEAGMRGVIYVTQDATGSRLLTLPNGSATPSGWSLSTTPSAIDRLEWEFDGTYFYWSMVKGLTLPVDADAAAYLSATGATDSTAINNFVTGLKAMGLWATSVCWSLRSTQNHGTGTTVRSFGGLGSFDGTMVGGPTWGANGMGFDGTDDRISIPNPARSASLAAFTLFSVFDSNGTANRAVFGGLNAAATQVAPQLLAGGSPLSGSVASALFGNFSLDGTSGNANGGILAGGNTGSWQTAALVADSSSAAIHANATSGSITPARASYWNDIATWFIGSRGGASFFFAGDISFAFFSTTKLTPQQLTDLRDLYKNTLGAGLGLP